MFGLNEVCAELIQNFDVPEFKRAWLDYCEYYNAPRGQRKDAIGVDVRPGIPGQWPLPPDGIRGRAADKPELADRAWRELLQSDSEQYASRRFTASNKRIEAGVDSLKPVDETNWMGTNDISMWGTAVIQNLALIGKRCHINHRARADES